jgi:hypothetical protein
MNGKAERMLTAIEGVDTENPGSTLNRSGKTSGGLNLGSIPAIWAQNNNDSTVHDQWNRCKANKGRTR